MNCPYCNNPVPPEVNNCPSCGAPVEMQTAPVMPQNEPVQAQENIKSAKEYFWMSIISLVVGIICFLAAFDDSEWDDDTVIGFLIFLLVAIINGIVVLCKEKKRKDVRGMAIAGIVLAGLALLI